MAVSVWEERHHPERLAGLLAGCRSERKLRLLVCGVIRHAPYHPDGRTVWDMLPSYPWFRPAGLDCQTAVATAEGRADGVGTAAEWAAAEQVGFGARYCAEAYTPMYTDTPAPGWWPAIQAAWLIERATGDVRWQRERLFGYDKSFREAVPSELHAGHGPAVCTLIRDSLLGPHWRKPMNPAWLTPPVRERARTAYEDRRFDGLPALADALAEAGCTHGAVLRHFREPGLHARGCWALDRVLGLG